MSRPVSSRQVARRVPNGWIGVSDSASSSTSALRRARLSTIATSWPQADRCRDVGQLVKPRPPRIKMRKESPSYSWLALAESRRQVLETDHGTRPGRGWPSAQRIELERLGGKLPVCG